MHDPVHCFGSWAPPPPTSTSRPPDVIHVVNAPRTSPFIVGLSFPCIIVNANGRQKQGGLGTRLVTHHFLFPLLLLLLPPPSSSSSSSSSSFLLLLLLLPPQGYLFVSVLIGETHDLLQLIIQAIRHDLESRNPVFNTLAMQCVANIATQDMAEQLGKDVAPLLVSPYVGGGGEGGEEGHWEG